MGPVDWTETDWQQVELFSTDRGIEGYVRIIDGKIRRLLVARRRLRAIQTARRLKEER